jgi:hypothetical protein
MTMNLKTLATLAAALISTSNLAVAAPNDQKCGAGSCGKKEASTPDDKKVKDASCSKKDASCSKKEGGAR